MILTAPIRGLSAEVVCYTAAAQMEFWNLLKATDDSAYIALPPHLQTAALNVNRSIGQAVESQHGLLRALAGVTGETVAHPEFAGVVGDLERSVAQSEAAIDAFNDMPESIVRLWRTNLEALAENNGYLDNYVESFRIAMDENCSALLAHLASAIQSDEATKLA